MHDTQLHAWYLGREAARADDGRARHRAEVTRLLAARRRARLRALLARLGPPRAVPPDPSRRPDGNPCPDTQKAAV
jgi:hypothetical protein